MNNLVVRVNDTNYLVRFQVLKSVVTRKHTTKEHKVTNRLEKHANSCEVYLYELKDNTINANTLFNLNTRKKVKEAVFQGAISYIGKGLSKCSDKDKFDKNTGVRTAIANIENLSNNLAFSINHIILNVDIF